MMWGSSGTTLTSLILLLKCILNGKTCLMHLYKSHTYATTINIFTISFKMRKKKTFYRNDNICYDKKWEV